MKQSMLLLFLLIVLFTRCDTTEPPSKANLTLTLEDVSCTEAWLMLKPSNMSLPAEVKFYKNGTVAQNNILCYGDTLLYVDSLLPKQTYTFQVSSIQQQVSSNQATATTLDTTSHTFSWQTFTFGQHGNSVLYDVAIINENNIWAAGKIYMKDTLGNNDPTFYNAAHWNGTTWELKKIFYKGGIWSIRTLFVFNENDIWFSGYMRYLNGQFIELPIPNILMGWQINKLWGSSSYDLYAVGNNGNIAYWDGVKWSKIESGTTVDLLDVWGSPGGRIVWACGENSKTVLIKIQNKIAQVVFEAAFPMQRVKNRFYDGLLSLWTNNTNFIYVLTPFNLYRCSNDTKGEGKELYPKEDYFRGGYLKVRGKNANDIFTCGNKTAIWHYNGFSWYEYKELRNENQYLPGLDYKGNTMVAAGEKYINTFYYQALIMLGKN